MSTPTDTDRTLLTVMASMRALPGQEEVLRQALEALVEPTRGDRGMVSYNLHRGVHDPGLFCFYENWTSEEALEEHLAAPHLANLVSDLDGVIDGEIVIHRVARIA
ncbi:putative quinol monooxygenase [soil metagenome]